MVQKTQELSKKLGSIKLVFFGFLLNCFFPLFLGPSQFLPKSWLLVILGLLLSGISGALIYGPIIALFVEILNKKYNDEKNCEIAGFLFNFVVIVGQFIGPIIGGFIIEKTNFLFSCNIISFMNCIFLLVFYFMNREKFVTVVSKTEIEDENVIYSKKFSRNLLYDFYNDEITAYQ